MIARRAGNMKVINPRLEVQLTRHLIIGNDDILLASLKAVKVDCSWTKVNMGQARFVVSLKKSRG